MVVDGLKDVRWYLVRVKEEPVVLPWFVWEIFKRKHEISLSTTLSPDLTTSAVA